jgi:hypothetical protein
VVAARPTDSQSKESSHQRDPAVMRQKNKCDLVVSKEILHESLDFSQDLLHLLTIYDF